MPRVCVALGTGGDAGQRQHTRTEALCQGTAAQFEAGKARGVRGIGEIQVHARNQGAWTFEDA